MIDGTYEVEAKTPLGAKKGQLVLACEDATCNAQLSIAGKTKKLVGVVANDEVTFTGSVQLPFPLGKVDYQLTGTVTGDVLQGVCKTKKFSFDVRGTRIA